jgi:hypothetical protein
MQFPSLIRTFFVFREIGFLVFLTFSLIMAQVLYKKNAQEAADTMLALVQNQKISGKLANPKQFW